MRGAPKAEQNLPSRFPENFTSSFRLSRLDGFDQVIRNKCLSDRCFKVFYKRSEKKNARLGIVVSKKVLPMAVSRNRMKRMIRETFRKHRIKLCGLDVVVFSYFSMHHKDFFRARDLEVLFNQVENRCAKCLSS